MENFSLFYSKRNSLAIVKFLNLREMKTLSRLKLNQLNAEELEQRQMNALRGGYKCGCGCNYVGLQGSSINDNYNANVSHGYTQSYGGNFACGDGVPTDKQTHS